MAGGYIKLHRSLLDHWLWKRPLWAYAWVDLLLLANHKDDYYTAGGEVVYLPPGSVRRSVSNLAARWGMDRKTASKLLDLMESEHMLSQKRTKHWTTITIENYEKFQGCGQRGGQPSGQPDGHNQESKNPPDILSDNTKLLNKTPVLSSNISVPPKGKLHAPRKKTQKAKNAFHNFNERDNDLDAIIDELVRKGM